MRIIQNERKTKTIESRELQITTKTHEFSEFQKSLSTRWKYRLFLLSFDDKRKPIETLKTEFFRALNVSTQLHYWYYIKNDKLLLGMAMIIEYTKDELDAIINEILRRIPEISLQEAINNVRTFKGAIKRFRYESHQIFDQKIPPEKIHFGPEAENSISLYFFSVYRSIFPSQYAKTTEKHFPQEDSFLQWQLTMIAFFKETKTLIRKMDQIVKAAIIKGLIPAGDFKRVVVYLVLKIFCVGDSFVAIHKMASNIMKAAFPDAQQRQYLDQLAFIVDAKCLCNMKNKYINQ